MIVTTEQYSLVSQGKTKNAMKGRINISASLRDKLGSKSRVINIIILEDGERVTAEELNKKLDKLEEVNDLFKRVQDMKEDLR